MRLVAHMLEYTAPGSTADAMREGGTPARPCMQGRSKNSISDVGEHNMRASGGMGARGGIWHGGPGAVGGSNDTYNQTVLLDGRTPRCISY